MTRLHADPVEVQRHDTGLGPEPAQFRWRGRLYVVREVLARWTESGGWWEGGVVQAFTAGDTAAGDRDDVGPAGVDDRERDWWRVEAGAGRAAGSSSGVYDLCFDWSRGSWSLARVLD